MCGNAQKKTYKILADGFKDSKCYTVTKASVQDAINQLENKSPGEDQLILAQLKMIGAPILADYLRALFESIINTRTMPPHFRSSRVLHVPKHGKQLMGPSSWMHIHLLPLISKVFGGTLPPRIIEVVDPQLSSMQFPYRRQLSTEMAIRRLIDVSKRTKSSILARFGISKAFGRVNPHLVLTQLTQWKMDTRLVITLITMVGRRPFHIQTRQGQHHAKSSTQVSKRGVPQ